MIAAYLFACAVAGPTTLELSRGCTIREATGQESRYWSATDTTLDSKQPDKSLGDGRLLTGGPGQVILIQFGDLDRAIGPNKKIVKATLLLNVLDKGLPKLKSVSEVVAPWGEGPCHTIMPTPIVPGAKIVAPTWSSTWKHRRAGANAIAWQQDGAQGPNDTKPLPDAKLVAREGDFIAVEGLEKTIQKQYERWYDNHGFALVFETPIAFNSSKSSKGRPKLVLELEDVAPKTGPDLSVTYIERTPEYERYDNRDAYTYKEQNGHTAGIMDKPGAAGTQKWPKDGEEVTYIAHVKNVGDAPAQGFSAQWVVRESPGSVFDVMKPLQPGEETTVSMTKPFKNIHTDHRVQPLGLKINPVGPDAIAANDYLEIQEGALNLGIWVEKGFYDLMAQESNIVGSRAFEDWVQGQFRIWNDVCMPFSRFSFAPEGALERTRVGRITIVPDGTLKGGAHLPGDKPTLIYDGEWGFEGPENDQERDGVLGYIKAVRQGKDGALLHEMSHQISLNDLYVMNVDPSMPDGTRGKVRLKENGSVVTRGAYDRFGGMMGGGDTRNESMLPGTYAYPQEPLDDPVLEAAELEPTDLYAATDVAALNSALGYRRGYFGEFMYDLPQPILVQALDGLGKPIPDAELTFFQMAGGEIPDKPAAFTLKTNSTGVVILPARETLEAEPFKTLTGHVLKPNPFGRIDVVGGNGVFMIRCTKNGATDWGWLKAWQMVDAFHRGQKAPLVRIRFQVPSEALDAGSNLAKDRIITDAAGSLPAQLVPLVDGAFDKTVPFGEKEGDWVEIDLGRDRAVGEVKLFARSADFWRKFDILVYSTGQKVSEARVWTHEPDWRFSATNRRDVDPKDFGLFSVTYRGQAERARFVRIVCREATRFASLAEIVVTPVKPTP
jgi:hypothetical protein